MIDFIHAPLQFVRPMTEGEWQDLMRREAQRAIRAKQRRAKHKALKIDSKSNRRVNARASTQVSHRAMTI